MARILLIRHGETSSNAQLKYQGQTDTPLNSNGIKQANYLAKKLKNLKISRIYASDLKRAYRTAAAISQKHGLVVNKIKELRERDFGVWEDLGLKEIKKHFLKLYNKWLKTPDINIPQAETFTKFKQRVLRGLKKILKNLKDKENIIIVGHGGVNRIILLNFLGLLRAKNFWAIKQDNACLNIIEIAPHYQMISLLNQHLNNLNKRSIKY